MNELGFNTVNTPRSSARKSLGNNSRDRILDNIQKTRVDKFPRYVNFPPTINAPSVGNPGMEGDIFFNRTTNTFYGHDGQIWRPLGGDASTPVDALYVVISANPSLTNERVLTAGTGILITDGGANGPVTINRNVAGTDSPYIVLTPNAELTAERVLTAGTAIAITDTGPNATVIISSTGPNIGDITLVSACPSGTSLVADGSGPDLQLKGFIAGTAFLLSSDSSCVEFAVNATSVFNSFVTLGNACPTGSLVDSSFGVRGLLAGTGIDLSADSSCVTLSGNASILNTNISLSNICITGTSLVAQGSGPNLEVKGIVSGTGVVINSGSDCVNLSLEATAVFNSNITLSNVCTSGTSLVADGSGPDLQLKGLVAGSGILLSSDASCVTIQNTGLGTLVDAPFVVRTASTMPPHASERIIVPGTGISADVVPASTYTLFTTPSLISSPEGYVESTSPLMGGPFPVGGGVVPLIAPTMSFSRRYSNISGFPSVVAGVASITTPGTFLVDYYMYMEATSIPAPAGGPSQVFAGLLIGGSGLLISSGRSAHTLTPWSETQLEVGTIDKVTLTGTSVIAGPTSFSLGVETVSAFAGGSWDITTASRANYFVRQIA